MDKKRDLQLIKKMHREITGRQQREKISISIVRISQKKSHLNRSNSKPSSLQQSERTKDRFALLLISILVITYIAFTAKGLLIEVSTEEYLKIVGGLLPYLIAILAHVLPYYFRKEGDKKDDEDS